MRRNAHVRFGEKRKAPAGQPKGAFLLLYASHVTDKLASIAERFIPTHVGVATPSIVSLYESTVHPHARGRLNYADEGEGAVIGLSPHAGGKFAFEPIAPRWLCEVIGSHLIIKERGGQNSNRPSFFFEDLRRRREPSKPTNP